MTGLPNAPVEGVKAFALAEDGTPLPVIDITNPAFALDQAGVDLSGRTSRFIAETTRQQKVPRWLMGLFMRLGARRSRLLGALLASRRGFVSGLTTYLLKLGPDNLVPPFDSDLDRQVADSLPSLSVRLRLKQLAEIMASGLAPQLRATPGLPLELINIAGGPAMDSLNALLLLHRDDPAHLQGRAISIHVLDQDSSGPAFGGRSLRALQADGAPLRGLDISFEQIEWDWRDLAQLRALLARLTEKPSVLLVSSEGGLFEYGSDAEILGCLKTLHEGTAPGAVLAGSVTRNDEATLLLNATTSRFRTFPRGLDYFGRLAGEAGYAIAESRSAVFSDQVLLVRQ